MVPEKGGSIAVVSLLLALLAFLPSIAPFTGAIFISVLAFLGALLGALFGWVRVAILTTYIVVATFLVSPISLWTERYIELGLLLITLIIIGLIIAVGLLINYRKSAVKT